MGFAFPKEERDALVAAEPHKFLLPPKSTLRYNWMAVRLRELEEDELEELILQAWSMAVPKSVSADFLLREPPR